MRLKRTLLSTLVVAGFAFGAGMAQAQISVKIGVLNDMSGLYADLTGPGSVVAAQLAVEDFGAAKKGIKVEIVGADHQNKPDVGSTIARQWYDRDGVDVIVDVPTSSVALAVNQITRERPVRRTRSTGPTTPGCWPTAPAARSSRPVATPGSS
jgi:branched-chain amino acid transport system substrate-binding protein